MLLTSRLAGEMDAFGTLATSGVAEGGREKTLDKEAQVSIIN